MKLLAAFACALLATPAAAQGSGPAKMLLIHAQGIAVTDYPSMARCEAARLTIRNEIVEHNSRAAPPRATAGGGMVFTVPTVAPQMFCTPA